MKNTGPENTSRADEEANGASSGIAARLKAFDLLEEVLGKGLSLDEALALPDRKDTRKLDTRDTAHARLLVMTVLRRLGQLDEAIKRFLTRRPSGRSRVVLTVLRLGAAQMIFLDTPAHAAVSTSLTLADKRKLSGFKGVINAVLRKIAKAAPHLLRTQDAARQNTPDWLWDSWVNAYGPSVARSIAEAHQNQAPLDLSFKQPVDDRVVEKLGALRLPVGSSYRLKDYGIVDRLAGFKTGQWWVQDVAASLPARLLIEGLKEQAVERPVVADLCAAPGGKTAQLMAAGFDVFSVEVSKKRLDRLQENMDRLDLAPQLVQGDALHWRPDTQLDGVLLDAPCSATGTIRRHPDLPWVISGEGIVELANQQVAMVKAAAEMLRPGGLLVFATCSLQPEEGPGVEERVLNETPEFALDAQTLGSVPGLDEAVTDEGYLRTLPSFWQARSGNRSGGMDGFFAARLKKQ